MSQPDYITGTPYALYHDAGIELGAHYDLNGRYYFLVREHLFITGAAEERVCLYKKDVVNFWLFGDTEPHDLLVSNEPRHGRRYSILRENMVEKIPGNEL